MARLKNIQEQREHTNGSNDKGKANFKNIHLSQFVDLIKLQKAK